VIERQGHHGIEPPRRQHGHLFPQTHQPGRSLFAVQKLPGQRLECHDHGPAALLMGLAHRGSNNGCMATMQAIKGPDGHHGRRVRRGLEAAHQFHEKKCLSMQAGKKTLYTGPG
jgi:hypothetical protein